MNKSKNKVPQNFLYGSNKYFASANTSGGFYSLFGEVFNPLKLRHIYILKGGPGCGKSTLMKNAAELASSHGLSSFLYHCSSDPSSLDGVIIKEAATAIIDGTAPHTQDPMFAGAKETVINLGEAWDENKIKSHSEEVLSITKMKKECYSHGYGYLAAAENIGEQMRTLSEKAINSEKLRSALLRFAVKNFGKVKTITLTNRIFADAITCKGIIRSFSPEETCKKLYFVKDTKSTSHILFNELLKLSEGNVVEMILGLSPINPDRISFIMYPEISLCISLYDDDYCRMLEKNGKSYSVINMDRFIDNSIFKNSRAKYKFCGRCEKELLGEALSYFEKAGKLHLELEEIYKSATNYEVVDEISNDVLDRILK